MKVSVVLPAYDVRPYIATAITSVLAQTHPDWELVIVDDGSSDGTHEVAAAFTDPRIHLIRQENAGVSAARNRGLAEASGEAVLFLDGDDWIAPDALARLVKALAAGDAVAACGTVRFVAEDGKTPGHATARRARRGDLIERLVVTNLFVNGGHILIRRAAITAAGVFATDLRYGEDWEYWCRLALLGRFAGVDDPPVLFVRQRPSGAYLRMANDPDSFAPSLNAVFNNPALLARFGPEGVARLRCRAEAENAWIIGRELIRHGSPEQGRSWLTRSVRANPSPKRALLLALSHLPGKGIGPFKPYLKS